MKMLWNVVGSIALVLAILGIFLPLLPTTPFLLLASACYLRGSERMHRWLLAHPLFGDYIRNMQENRGIPLKAKVIAILLMWASMSWSMTMVASIWLKTMLATIGILVTLYLLIMKTLETEKQNEEEGQD